MSRARAPSSPWRARRPTRPSARRRRHRRHRRFHAADAAGRRGGPGPHAGADGGAQAGRAWWTPAAWASSACSRGWSASSRATRSCPAEPFRAGELDFSPAALADVAAERDFQFCTEVLVRGEQLPPANEVRQAMHAFGGSIVVATVSDILKIHVHTDTPDAVFTLCGTLGPGRRDQGRGHAGPAPEAGPPRDAGPWPSSATARPTSPTRVLDRHHIALGPAAGDLRGPGVPGPAGAQAGGVLPPAPRGARSCPRPRSPHRASSSGPSGTRATRPTRRWCCWCPGGCRAPIQSAQAALRASELDGVHLFDSRSASLGLGMLGLRAAELAESGWKAPDIVTELERIRRQSGMFLTVDTYDNLIRSGRVSRGKAWLGGLLDVKPILTLNPEGPRHPGGPGPRPRAVVPRMLRCWSGSSHAAPGGGPIRHRPCRRPGGGRAAAHRARGGVRARRMCFVSLATGVLGTHVGFGAVGGVLPGGGRYARAAWRRVTRLPKRHGTRCCLRAVAQAIQAAEDRKARQVMVLDLRAGDRCDRLLRDRVRHVGRPRARRSPMRCWTRWAAGQRRRIMSRDYRVAAGCCSTTSTSWCTSSIRRRGTFYQLERLWGDAPVVFRGGDEPASRGRAAPRAPWRRPGRAVPATAHAQYFFDGYFGQNKVQYSTFDFQIIQTDHFDVYFYQSERTAALDAARMAERSYARLSRILNHRFTERKIIILYASPTDFAQTNTTDVGEGTQGVTDFFRQRNVLFLQGALTRDRARAHARDGAPVPVRRLLAGQGRRQRAALRRGGAAALVHGGHGGVPLARAASTPRPRCGSATRCSRTSCRPSSR